MLFFPFFREINLFWTGKRADGRRKEKLLSIFIEVEYFMQKTERRSFSQKVPLVLGKKGRTILWIFQNIRFCSHIEYHFQQQHTILSCKEIENIHSCRHQFQLDNFLLGDDFCKKFSPGKRVVIETTHITVCRFKHFSVISDFAWNQFWQIIYWHFHNFIG